LLIARRFYDTIGGHSPDANADATLLHRLGRRRMVMLPATVIVTSYNT
jgi:hypothetical protein